MSRRIARRTFLRMASAGVLGGAIASCSRQVVKETVKETVEVAKTVQVEVTSAPARDAYGLPNAATGIPYEVKSSINGGQPITLEYWEWALNRAKYETKWAQEYMNIYRNVTINVTNITWDEYWKKILVNVPAGQGPTLWHMHTDYLRDLCDASLMDPMPEYVADQEFLNLHWPGFTEGPWECPKAHSRHFIPMGIQMTLLYINRALWEEAGLADADIPKSWEDLRRAAKALTKTDASGRIVQAGLSTNGDRDIQWFANALWQQGRWLYTKDLKHVYWDSQEGLNALKFMYDLYYVDKVIDAEFPEANAAFASGQLGMLLTDSYYAGVVRSTNPDLQWFVAPIPTFSGEQLPALGRKHAAVEAVVNAYAPPETKAVAWDFWHFLYSNDQRLVNDIALGNGFTPVYDKLLTHPAVKADPTASAAAPNLEYNVWLGTHPSFHTEVFQNFVWDPMTVGGASVEDALQAGKQEMERRLAEFEADQWNVLERNYGHADGFLPDQE